MTEITNNFTKRCW